jgi:transposase
LTSRLRRRKVARGDAVRAEIVLLVECRFGKLKQFRRVASRYNQTLDSFSCFAALAPSASGWVFLSSLIHM